VAVSSDCICTSPASYSIFEISDKISMTFAGVSIKVGCASNTALMSVIFSFTGTVGSLRLILATKSETESILVSPISKLVTVTDGLDSSITSRSP